MSIKLKDDSSSEDEESTLVTVSKHKKSSKKITKSVKRESSDEDDDILHAARKKQKRLKKDLKDTKTRNSHENGKSSHKTKKKTSKTIKKESENIDDEDKTLADVASQSQLSSSTKASSVDIKESSEDFKWWENNDKEDDSIKWTTLRHNGVIFPPEYQPLPSHVKLYYDGKPVDLPPQAEEVAGFFAAMLETDHVKLPIFQKNFMHDFLEVLKENGGTRNNVEIKDFEKLDFTKIAEYFQVQKEQKKQLSPQEKKQLKLEKEEFEKPYKFCEIDGRIEQVGNFRIEPPGLFRGRGAHPKNGKLKRRVYPEDVVLNLDKNAPIPEPPKGHKWGEIRHDNTVQWLSMWRENITNSFKYVRFAANSTLKGISDFKKFEKARMLKDHIDKVRADYKAKLKSPKTLDRQMAVATYLIDVFALRAGGEKSEDEADTVGCCSLRYEHVTLKPPNTVIFDFLGKDSIRYYQEVEVDAQVFKNLKIFKRPPSGPGHQLFDRLDPSILNKHLQNYMPGLTAKVFRTYNASKTMQDQLDLIPNEGTVAEKMLRYNAANRTVAILCNHQRTVTKGHATSVQKATERIEELEWQKVRYKRAILQLDKSERKKDPNYFKEIDDLSKEEELTIHKRIIEREREKYKRKFERENEKRKFDKEEALPDSQLMEWLAKVDDLEKQYQRESDTGIIEVRESLKNVEKLKQQVERLEKRITNASLQLKDKEDNSTVALGTSKINYIDPRLSVAFCKKFDVPIEKVFTKTLREKFRWAIESADENWRF
ncbi:DNA topoisomerase 1 [Kluyveromyces marxianus]|uniref:DNA topoisomerase I n=2 Tax=Kluyveromyces marxianus TaxID=4911 RepID=W0T520_KLUMD|nr:DNA topoisomerase 1 [Kluyveromyces marxianus DMKU3-1042]QGN13947.1 DNA topoisomerase 1 [Kluyveromyces marxianus]BAO37891.1 DNA topoisomerase 1 [Kluyveromyces marxianus DMKU3-1042]